MAAHFSILRTLTVGVLAFPVTAVVTFHVAMWAAPSFSREGHHPLMPIGQALIALVVGFVGSIIAMVVDRHLQHRAVERAYSLEQFMPQATAREVPRKPAP